MDNQTRNIVLAGVGGLAVGAVLGVLFAPDKGKNTRAKLANKANDLMDQVKSSAETEAPEEMLASIKDKLTSSLNNGKSELRDELVEQIEQLEKALEK
ncbi:MAG: YtxH domain-containing protein [Fluviicola sp.]